MKTLIDRTCGFVVYVTDNDKDILCGKPGVEKAQRGRHCVWLCAEHFAQVLCVAILMNE